MDPLDLNTKVRYTFIMDCKCTKQLGYPLTCDLCKARERKQERERVIEEDDYVEPWGDYPYVPTWGDGDHE